MLESEQEWEQHHLRVMIETAQRAGRSEQEIRALVAPYLRPVGPPRPSSRRDAGVLRRIFGLERGRTV